MILGVSRHAIHRYLMNQRIPQPPILQRIIELTDGQVQLTDFLDNTPPKCAKVINRPDGTQRWIFSWSNAVPERSAMYSRRLSQPLLRAIEVLDGRGWYSPKGRFLLDGRISDPKRIVAAANGVLRERDQPVIKYPIVEPIDE